MLYVKALNANRPYGRIDPRHPILQIFFTPQHAKDKGDKRMNMLRRLAGGGRKKSKSPPTVGPDPDAGQVRQQQPQAPPNAQPHGGKISDLIH